MITLNTTNRGYLYHHGIKGMKWGVRNYRNYDGTLTSAGKARYGGSTARHKLWKAKQRLDAVDDKDIRRMSKADKNVQNVANNVSSIASKGKPSNRYAGNHKTLTQEEMARTSDKELQQIINRLNMETNYTRLTEEPTAMERVATGLQYVAAASSIAVSAVTIYSALKNK